MGKLGIPQGYIAESGSIITGSLIVTDGITGSLYGTSSWSTEVVTGSVFLIRNDSTTFDRINTIYVTGGLITSPGTGILSMSIVGAAGAPGGPPNALQFNSSSQFSGSNNLTFDYNTNILSLTGSAVITNNITGSRLYLSASGGTANGSTLRVYGSGSAHPVVSVQGSQGQLFTVTDSLSGSLFSVNDVSGLRILEAFSDSRILFGNYQASGLITTIYTVSTAASTITLYSLPTASYDGFWFEYTARSGSNARAGQMMGIWSGSAVNYTETTTTDFGTTTGITFGSNISSGNMIISTTVGSANWIVKGIVRSI